MGRRASESAACNLIPKTDYPKTGYMVETELSVVFISGTKTVTPAETDWSIKLRRREGWPSLPAANADDK
jgi:hypothetical protein